MNSDIIKTDVIQNCIYTIRGLQVMIDSDLAAIYQVETKQLQYQNETEEFQHCR